MTPPDTTLIRLLAQIINRQMRLNDIQPNHWAGLISLAQQHNALPLLHEAVHASPGDDVPRPILQQISMRGLQAKARAARIENEIVAINHILDEAGIPALWLKGSALAYTIYPAFWLRPMMDVDVLVPYEQRRQARAALNAAGYIDNATHGVVPAVGQRLFDGLQAVGYPDNRELDDVLENSSHHYVFLGRENKGVTIELHFRLLNIFELAAEDVAWFWRHTQTVAGPQQQKLRVMTPAAMLLHLAAHNVVYHQQFDITDQNATHVTLRSMYDVYQLVTQYVLDWSPLLAQAVKLHWESALAHTLIQANSYFPFPQTGDLQNVLAVLRNHEGLPSPGQLARSNAVHRSILIWRILRHLPWRRKFAYLVHALFPPRETMQSAYPDRLLWLAYLTRSFKIVDGVIRTLYYVVIGKR